MSAKSKAERDWLDLDVDEDCFTMLRGWCVLKGDLKQFEVIART